VKISARLLTMIVEDIIDDCDGDPEFAKEMRPLLERLYAIITIQRSIHGE